MGAAQKTDSPDTLEEFIDLKAEQTITEEEVQRILGPVLKKIEANEFSKVNEESNKLLLQYLTALMTAETASGNVKIIVIESKDDEGRNHCLIYRGEY